MTASKSPKELGEKAPAEVLASITRPEHITLGTDPEFFGINKTTGRVVPAAFLTGEKQYSLPYGVLMSDGAALEMTVKYSDSPSTLARMTWENIRAAQQRFPQITLSVRPILEIAKEDFDKCIGEKVHKSCALDLFGCTPDRIIYEEDRWERPLPTSTRKRSLGGHIHFGYPRVDDAFDCFVAALLDWTVGVAGQAVFFSDESFERRTLYGRAGTIRRNDVTLEYRVLSAQQLVSGREYMTDILRLGQRVVFDAIRLFVKRGTKGLQEVFGNYSTMASMQLRLNIHEFGSPEEYITTFIRGQMPFIEKFSPEVALLFAKLLIQYTGTAKSTAFSRSSNYTISGVTYFDPETALYTPTTSPMR